MWLRSKLNERLEVKSDEVRLSSAAGRFAFLGSYGVPGAVMTSLTKEPSGPSNRAGVASAYRIRVTRETPKGGIVYSGTGAFSPSYTQGELSAFSEFDDPRTLTRVHRIERTARRIKGAAALVLALAVGSGLYASLETDSSSSTEAKQPPAATAQPNEHIEACAELTNGAEVLLRITPSEVGTYQRLGDVVCTLGSFDYVAITQPQTAPVAH